FLTVPKEKTPIRIERIEDQSGSDDKFDLIIDLHNDDSIKTFKYHCNKYIKAIKRNIYNINEFLNENIRAINVDYKRSLKEKYRFHSIGFLEFLINTALESPQQFYNEYALLDKPFKKYSNTTAQENYHFLDKDIIKINI
ncbi:hypothetical protein, partial [Bacillus smithii]|uniref:hypothetical protein n=1 Tax=Bacillus smithii TaxID=1479 RepID=UPI003D231F93